MKRRESVGELYLGNENLKEVGMPKINKVAKNGSLTIPASIRRELGINHLDRYRVAVDGNTGDIILKRIAGVDCLSPINEDLFNFNGRLVSIQSAIELSNVVEEIRTILSKELGEEISIDELPEYFSRIWADGDTFITNPILNSSKYLRSLETRTSEIKDAIEREKVKEIVDNKKEKSDERKRLIKEVEKDFKKAHILDRITKKEAEQLLLKKEYNRLKKEYEENKNK